MKNILCIVCPNGCRLSIDERIKDGAISGNQCARGIDFAMAEMSNPTRSLTTTVRTAFPQMPVLPVRTAGEIPKGKINELMHFINTITIDRPLGIGEAVAENALGLGVNIVATSNVLMEEV